ncbi:MAG: hypothetical protein MUD17_04260 [Gemmatimonadaceae bacterium]|jgi:hypothetical protein|nr:hypothetical protein [Gemmatimonadaceae bacterium]
MRLRLLLSTVPLVLAGCLFGAADIVWEDETPVLTRDDPTGVVLLDPPVWLETGPPALERARRDWLASRELDNRDAPAKRALETRLAALPAAQAERAAGEALPALEVPPVPSTTLGTGPAPDDSARCPGSLRLESTPRGEVAVWWSLRDGLRVHLLASWRYAGDSAWRGPIPVDTLDQGSSDARDVPRGIPVGCGRPPAGLSVDAVNGFVHVAYALVGPEGPGFFYAHQMDPRGGFEPPQPIVYGERLGPARVASDGNVVAVAYEDPNSGTRRRVALAISRTAGHLWEGRHLVSSGLNLASDPLVVVRRSGVVIGWYEVPPMGGDRLFFSRAARIP